MGQGVCRGMRYGQCEGTGGGGQFTIRWDRVGQGWVCEMKRALNVREVGVLYGVGLREKGQCVIGGGREGRAGAGGVRGGAKGVGGWLRECSACILYKYVAADDTQF